MFLTVSLSPFVYGTVMWMFFFGSSGLFLLLEVILGVVSYHQYVEYLGWILSFVIPILVFFFLEE